MFTGIETGTGTENNVQAQLDSSNQLVIRITTESFTRQSQPWFRSQITKSTEWLGGGWGSTLGADWGRLT